MPDGKQFLTGWISMRELSKQAKRERLQRTLDGDTEVAVDKENSELYHLTRYRAPLSWNPTLLWLCGTVVAALLLAVGYLYREQLPGTGPRAVVFGLALASVVFGFILSAVVRGSMEGFRSALDGPLREVTDLRIYVTQLLQDHDRRTERFFHAVTITKVTSYFVLTQLGQLLGDLSEEVESLLKSGSSTDLYAAYRKLSGTITYSDSVIPSPEHAHTVALVRVRAIIQQLGSDLEASVSELEREIAQGNQEVAAEPHSLGRNGLRDPRYPG